MRTLLLPGVGLLFVLTGCGLVGGNDKCETEKGYSRTVAFDLVDANGAVIPLAPPRYHPDSVRLYRLSPTQGRVQLRFMDPSGYNSLSVIRRDETYTYGIDLEDTYLLYLNHADQDTITFRYRLFKDDCNDPDVDGIRIFFNGRDVFNGPRGVNVGLVKFPKR